MNRFPLIFLAVLAFFTQFSHSSGPDTLQKLQKKTVVAKPVRKAIVIPVENEVDYGLHAFLKRAVAEALAKKPDVLIFKVNTYGGELQSAFDIVDLLMGVKQCSTYAYVEQKAISAGALISLANNRIAMGKGTTLGDCAPITQSQDGIVMLGEKIQSPLRAKFRTLAEKNGYPAVLSEAMVTADMGAVAAVPAEGPMVYFSAKQWEKMDEKEKKKFKSSKVILPEGQLLTMTDREAEEYGFSEGSFESLDAFLADKGWEKMAEFETTWSEDMVRVIGKFAPILMLIGFGALYMEFKTPGLSIFGGIGLLCLAIVFGSKYAVGLANHTELLLLLAGFALFLVEIYLFPGTLIAGGLGLLLMIVALTLSLQSFTIPDPSMPWEMEDSIDNLTMTLGMAMLAIGIPLIAIKYVLPRLPAKASVISHATLADARSTVPDTLRLSPGLVGTAKTPLRPTGKAMFGDKTLEVSSRGEFIEPGAAVEVWRIEGNKVVVRLKETPA